MTKKSQVNKILGNIYFNPGGPGSFSSLEPLYFEAKKYLSSITRRDVKKFLSENYVSIRSRVIRKPKGKPFQTLPMPITNANLKMQCDLMFTDHKKYPAALVCSDQFSSKLFGQKITSKNSKTVATALEKIIGNQNNNVWPVEIGTDYGGEFRGASLLDLLKKHDVKIKYMRNWQHAPQIESKIAKLRSRLNKMILFSGINDFTRHFDNAIDSLNSSVQPRTGYTPNNVHENSNILAGKIFEKKYKKYLTSRDINSFKQMYKIGDPVRIYLGILNISYYVLTILFMYQ